MRLFTALEINTADRQAIYNWADRYLMLPAKQVAHTNYHVTLAFFGEIKNESIESLAEQLDLLHANTPINSFTLRLDQVAFWPKTGIIWIGPRNWPQTLTKLAASHASIGSRYGAKKSHRQYQPHISLTRGADSLSPPLLEPEIDIAITHVTLYESQRNASGKIDYQSVERWPLQNHITN